MRGRRSRPGAFAVLAPVLLLVAAVVVAEASGQAFSIARLAPVPGTRVVLEGPVPVAGAAADSAEPAVIAAAPSEPPESGESGEPAEAGRPGETAPAAPGEEGGDSEPAVEVSVVVDDAGAVRLVVCGDLLVGAVLEVRTGGDPGQLLASGPTAVPCTTVPVPLTDGAAIELEIIVPTPFGTVLRSVAVGARAPEDSSATADADGALPEP